MKHLSVKTMQAILLIFTLSLICEGCSAQTGNSSSMFAPSIRLTFKVSKKVYCTAYVDFGLKQICLRDNKGEVIKMFGIKDDSFIKFANVIFPNDEFLMFMLNQK